MKEHDYVNAAVVPKSDGSTSVVLVFVDKSSLDILVVDSVATVKQQLVNHSMFFSHHPTHRIRHFLYYCLQTSHLSECGCECAQTQSIHNVRVQNLFTRRNAAGVDSLTPSFGASF